MADKFGIALTQQEWKKVTAALGFKIKRGKEMGLATYVKEEEAIKVRITEGLKRLLN
jgi:hypothetical protein